MINYCLTKLTSSNPGAIFKNNKQIKFIAPFKQESKELATDGHIKPTHIGATI
jgi:hypothetical protein